jgi:hypothetical protein
MRDTQLEQIEPEVGEPTDIVTTKGTIRAIWLGTIGENGWNLTKAMRLMVNMEREREDETE